MKNILVLITLILISCNSKDESKSESDVTYRILIKENEKYNSYLIENIKLNIGKNSSNEFVKYDSLTNAYVTYLSELETEIVNKTTEIFFQGDKYSAKGKEFINRTKTYKTEIEQIVKSENLKKRINLVLNTNDVQQSENMNEIAENNETNKHSIGKISIFYLDYYYKGVSKYQCLAFLNNKKRSILEIENEFITSIRK